MNQNRHRAWLLSLLVTTGCAGLYNQGRYDLATNAQKSIADAKLENVLDDERTQNGKIARDELDIVARQLAAARDAELIEIIDQPNAEVSRKSLRDKVVARLKRIANTAILQAAIDLASARDALDAGSREYQVAAGPTDPALRCTDETLSVSPAATQTWKRYQDKCKKVAQAAKDMMAALESGGDIAEIEKRVKAAQKFATEVTAKRDELTKRYKAEAKEIDARRKRGEVVDLGRQAAKLKSDIANVKLPSEADLSKLGITGLKAELAIDWIDTQRAVLDRLLAAAAAGTAPADDDLQLAAMLPSVAAELQGGIAFPRVTSLVHELNRLGIERDSMERQADRARQEIALLTDKQESLLREGVLLVEARAALNAAETDCPGIAQAQTFRSVAAPCGEQLRRALYAYEVSWTVARLPQLVTDWKLIQLDHDRALDASERALRAWNSLISVQLDALVASYASGVKPETFGRLVNAIEMGAIAAGVQ